MLRFLTTRQFWQRLAITAGTVLLLLLMAGGLVAWWVNHQWNVRIDAIRAAGDPASIADLAPEPIPDDQNAAAILESIGPQLEAFHKDYMRFIYDTPLGRTYRDAEDKGEPLSAEQVAAIRGIIDQYPEVSTALAKAAACSQYASLADFSLPAAVLFEKQLAGYTDRIRTVVWFNDWRRVLLLADGQPEQAARVGLETLRLVRLHNAEPLLTNYMVDIAVRSQAVEGLYGTLAAGPVSPELHRQIDDELARQDDPQAFKRTLVTERAFAIGQMETGVVGEQGERTLDRSAILTWYGPGLLDEFDELIAAANRPWYELQRDTDSYEVHSTGNVSYTTKSTGHGTLADLLAPAIIAAQESDARATVMLRALRIFNAIKEYRQTHGHDATGLADLALPKEATIDPFSGQPLLLKHTGAGWIIYSVMENGVDDGGDFKDRKDYGLAPSKNVF